MLFRLPPYARQYKTPPKDISVKEGLAMTSYISIFGGLAASPLIGPFAIIPIMFGIGAGAAAISAPNKVQEEDNNNLPRVVRSAAAVRIPTDIKDIPGYNPSSRPKLNRILPS